MKKNPIVHILVSGAAGTLTMSAASALMSELMDENFREPEHLETLIGRLAPGLAPRAKQIAAWGAHFDMGFMFAAIYVELWRKKRIKRTFRNGLILGAASGVLGYLIWKGTFKAHPLPPWLNYDHFYLQRIPAHIFFAVAATLTSRLLEENLPLAT